MAEDGRWDMGRRYRWKRRCQAGQASEYSVRRLVQINLWTDYYMVLRSGMQKRTFSSAWCVISHPDPHEFDTFKSRLFLVRGALPERPELYVMLKSAGSFIV